MLHLLKTFILSCTLITLIACSSNKHIGKSLQNVSKYSCPIPQSQCGGEDKEVIVKYKVSSLGNNQYLIKGTFTYKLDAISPIFDNVEDVSMTFLLSNKGRVVHQELIREGGLIGEAIEFKKVINTIIPFDSSSLVDLRVVLTQAG